MRFMLSAVAALARFDESMNSMGVSIGAMYLGRVEPWNPELEKQIGRRIATAIGTPSWWKRVRAWMNRPDGGSRVSALICYHLAPVALAGVTSLLGGREMAAAWLAVFWFGMVPMSAGRVQWRLFGESYESSAWGNLPVSDPRVFDVRWGRFKREFLWS